MTLKSWTCLCSKVHKTGVLWVFFYKSMPVAAVSISTHHMHVTWFSLSNITMCVCFNSMQFSSFCQVGQELGEKSTLEMGMESKLP